MKGYISAVYLLKYFVIWDCNQAVALEYGYTVLLKEEVKPEFLNILQQNHPTLRLKHQITPTTYIFDYGGSFDEFKALFENMLVDAEPVRVYDGSLRLGGTDDIDHYPENPTTKANDGDDLKTDQSNQYGMEVEVGWKSYSGNGVVIGVADTEIGIDHDESNGDVNHKLSFNFIEHNHKGDRSNGMENYTNKDLSYRDVQHLLVRSSDRAGLKTNFTQNAAGHYFHSTLGYGLLNAERLVSLAAIFKPVPELMSQRVPITDRGFGNRIITSYSFDYSCETENVQTCISSVEHVVIDMKFRKCSGTLSATLSSPERTVSKLLENEPKAASVASTALTSVHFWDESAIGIWRLTVVQRCKKLGSIDMVTNVSLSLYGTPLSSKTKSTVSGKKSADAVGLNVNQYRGKADFKMTLTVSSCILVAFLLTLYAIYNSYFLPNKNTDKDHHLKFCRDDFVPINQQLLNQGKEVH